MRERERPDNITEPNIELAKESSVISILPEKERKLLESLDRKVEISSGLKDLIDSIEIAESSDNIYEKLNNYITEVKSGFPQEVLNLVEEYNALEKEYRTLRKNLGKSGFHDGKEERRLDYIRKVSSRLEEILKSNDAVFLIEMEQIVKNLVKKNKYINKRQHDTKFLIEDGLNTGYESDTADEDSVVNVTVEPFNIIYTIKEEDWGEDYPKYAAFHTNNSPYIFINGGIKGSEREQTIRHEKVHNVLDQLERHFPRNFSFEFMEDEIELYEDAVRMHQSSLETVRHKRVFGIKPFTIINSLHEEIAASLEHIHQNKFSEFYRSTDELVSMALYKEKELKLEGTMNVFETAGARLKKILKLLNEKSKNGVDEELRSFCADLKKETEDYFLDMVDQMKEAEFITKELNEENQFKKEILYALLRPNQYHHIKKFFEFKYGKEKIDKILSEKSKIITL